MRVKCIAGLLLSFVLPLTLWAQIKEYEITGHIEGLKDGEKVTMEMATGHQWPGHDYDSYLVKQDSGVAQNGEFHITGFVPEGPREYRMTFDKHNNTRVCFLYIDNGEKITIRGTNIDSIPH